MSLEKAIEHRKEHRRPYYKKAKRDDPWCRNHGGCYTCRDNRLYSLRKRLTKAREEMKEE